MTTTVRDRKLKPPDVNPLIPKACAVLDELLTTDRWDELINLRTLNLDSAISCVLGQTGYAAFEGEPIPGDGQIPWACFQQGIRTVRHWLDAHPTAATQIGTHADEIGRVFNAGVPTRYAGYAGTRPITQNQQWRLWIRYRQAQRAQAQVDATSIVGSVPQ